MSASTASPPSKVSGGASWVQLVWWTIVDICDELKVCAFSLTILVVFALVLFEVAQGVEPLRVVGEGAATIKTGPVIANMIFFCALLLWGLCSWYSARVLLYFEFPRRRARPKTSLSTKLMPSFTEHLPRVLGALPFVIIGLAFLDSAHSYAATESAKGWLIRFGWFSLLGAIIFYVSLIFRRRIVGGFGGNRFIYVCDIPRATWIGLAILAVLSVLMLVGSTFAPVATTKHIGSASLLLLAAASWCCFGGVMIFASNYWDLPIIRALLALAILSSLWNDNHEIRETSAQEFTRPDLLKAFTDWHEKIQKRHPTAGRHPCYIVAAEGGGVRAAYWTSMVLGSLQDHNPEFSTHLFAISGVSGGSLGAAVFTGLLKEPAFKSVAKRSNEILGQDFLSPALAAMLYPDLIQRFIPIPIDFLDRSRALEGGWEAAWQSEVGNNRFGQPFMNLWPVESVIWTPALFLNGTSVEKGNRIIASNLRITSAFLDTDDLAELLRRPDSPRLKASPNVALSTAAHMSARFTFVSPAGRLPDGSHVVDGGYFENSGATTAHEVAARIRAYCSVKGITNVDIKLIMISNNPRRLPVAPAAPPPSSTALVLTESTLKKGSFLGELTSPLWAILNTRDAHGTYAQQSLHRDQRRWRAGTFQPQFENRAEQLQDEADTPDMIYFSLGDRKVPLPLGWALSKAAAREIEAQIYIDDGLVKNGSAIKAVLQSLPVQD